jgi:hypothetical protein
VSAARITGLVLAAACAAGHARAQDDVSVVSPRADSIAVTIYRDDLALITETRTVSLPASPVTLVLDGVVETLLPQSAVIADAARPLAESNFGFNRLTPKSLLERSIGETVTITRTNPVTGTVTRTAATILSAGEGVVLQIAGGHEALYCAGLPERLEFQRIPSELLAKPQLSVKLAAGEPGPRTVKVSYLAHGFAWSSDYVAHLGERSDRMALKGWATLTNSTGTAFEQAEVQVVAGRLNILGSEEGGSRAEPVYAEEGESDVDARARLVEQQAVAEVALLRDCFATELPPPKALARSGRLLYDLAAPMPSAAALEEIAVTGSRIAAREELGDYQLYRLPWLTDLGARQTKQVLFLDKPAVRVERFYGFRLQTFTDPPAEDVVVPSLIVRWENTERAGLGEPLPSGIVRVFEPYAGREVFGGEAEIDDKPVGLPVELTIGRALNVALEVDLDWSREEDERRDACVDRTVVTAEHRIVNNKSVPVDLEIRHPAESYYRNAQVDESSRPMRKKYGDFAWRFAVPPGAEGVLRYELSALEDVATPDDSSECSKL